MTTEKKPNRIITIRPAEGGWYVTVDYEPTDGDIGFKDFDRRTEHVFTDARKLREFLWLDDVHIDQPAKGAPVAGPNWPARLYRSKHGRVVEAFQFNPPMTTVPLWVKEIRRDDEGVKEIDGGLGYPVSAGTWVVNDAGAVAYYFDEATFHREHEPIPA